MWYWKLIKILCFQETVAQRSVRWQLRERSPDVAQYLLSPSDTGPDRHHCPGWFSPGPQPDLLQAAGTQRGNPWHDPPRAGLPGRHNLPPRLQRLRDQPLTGTQESPTLSLPTFTSTITATTDPAKAISACSYRGRAAPTHLAAASPGVSAASAAQFQADASLPSCTALTPEPYLEHDPHLSLLSSSSFTADSDTSLLDFPKPPDLFSSHSFSNTPDFTLPRAQEPRRSRPSENTNRYYPFTGCLSHSSNPHGNKRRALTSSTLSTVASETTLLTHSDTNASPYISHLPHFPCSPYKHSSPDTVLTHGPASSSSLPPPPPQPPCPTSPGKAAAWGCCCSLGDAAAPLSHYLGKVGHAALPLMKVGGLLKAEPSDVQTWDINLSCQRTFSANPDTGN